MSYIGATPQIGGYHKLDQITTNGSASYTMQLNSGNFVPESANHLIVSVNGVIQAPTDSFTVSGSTITFASTLSVSDTIDFIMALGNTLDIGTPSDNTVSSSKIVDGAISSSKLATTSITGQTAEATANDADSILIYDDSATALRKMTRANFLSGVGGSNTPAFEAKLGSGQSFPDNTGTIVQFDTEEFDTDSAYDTSTYRFTPQTAGKYYVYASIASNAGANSELRDNYAFIVKNGTNIKISHFNYSTSYIRYSTAFVCAVVDLNGSTDYVQARVQGADSSGNLSLGTGEYSTFGAYRIIE